ncbi:MAG: ABC transporter substrate-binding protein [Rikenellaceae bacterium]
MKRLICFFLLFSCSHLVSAKEIIFTTKWTPQSQFAGYYVAFEKGFYQAEGLNVKIVHPTIAESSYSFLKNGRSQFVVMNLSQALMAKAEGLRVVNVMQTSQTNSLMLVSRKPLKDFSSLRGKKVAVWSHLSQDLLDMLNRRYNLSIEWVRFNGGVDIFLSGAVDICLLSSFNEFLQLKENGWEPHSSQILRFSDHGYNLPDDGLYVMADYYQTHRDEVEKFVKASVKGWKWTSQNKESALDIVMSRVRENKIGTNRYHQRLMLDEILRLQCDGANDAKSYKISADALEKALQAIFPKGEMLKIQYSDFVN